MQKEHAEQLIKHLEAVMEFHAECMVAAEDQIKALEGFVKPAPAQGKNSLVLPINKVLEANGQPLVDPDLPKLVPVGKNYFYIKIEEKRADGEVMFSSVVSKGANRKIMNNSLMFPDLKAGLKVGSYYAVQYEWRNRRKYWVKAIEGDYYAVMTGYKTWVANFGSEK